ncbi:MAG: hypothetical protein DRN31_02020 [Thermoplasmata archaeon]|nr:MAG: hypothetical protein DRN31_02020 [Thermoplasmata archaeon]
MKAEGVILCIIIALIFVFPSAAIKNTSNEESLLTIFDVRGVDEYNEGHIKGAVSVPVSKLLCGSCTDSIFNSYANDTIAIYCGNDEKAGELALKILERNGMDAHIMSKEESGNFIFEKSCNLNSEEHATGCIPLDSYDVKERNAIATGNYDELPPRWDWRHATYHNVTGDWTTPVKSQGSCGSCWDFAAMGALEAIINIRTNNPRMDVDLSEQYLLSCPPSSGGCSGWNAYWAYGYLFTHGGAITEECFPYEANDRIPCYDKCPNWRDNLFPIIKYGAMRNRDRDEIKSMVFNFGPVVAEMAVYSDFGSYTGGIYEHPGDEPTSDINHQVVIVGYDDDQECWIVKNSWGSNWGENGFFRIAYGDCQIEHEIVYADFSPIIARAGGPYFSNVGEQVQFDGSHSCSFTSYIVSYSWDFGDGSTGEGKTPTHTYSSEGKFTVHLTVTDADGNQGVCKTYVYIDSTPPSIEIIKPEKRHFYYFNDDEGMILLTTLVIGKINVIASASDNISGLERMEIYVDDHLVYESDEGYVDWDWDGPAFGRHVLKVEAYDIAGNAGVEELRLWIWM